MRQLFLGEVIRGGINLAYVNRQLAFEQPFMGIIAVCGSFYLFNKVLKATAPIPHRDVALYIFGVLSGVLVTIYA